MDGDQKPAGANVAPITTPIATEHVHKPWGIIIAVLITAGLAGGGVYGWHTTQLQKLNSTITDFQTTEEKFDQQLKEQQTNVAGLTSSTLMLKNELLDARFRLALAQSDFPTDPLVIRDTAESSRFFYMYSDAALVANNAEERNRYNIQQYNALQDPSWSSDMEVDLNAGSTVLVREDLPIGEQEEKRYKRITLKLLGFHGGLLTFTQVPANQVLFDACSSPYLGDDKPPLFAINTTIQEPAKEVFAPTEELKKQERERIAKECTNS